MTRAIYQIDKDIPVPERRRGRPAKYPFAIMEPGDSIAARPVVAVQRAASAHAKRHGRKFVCRAQGDGTVRVWRVA